MIDATRFFGRGRGCVLPRGRGGCLALRAERLDRALQRTRYAAPWPGAQGISFTRRPTHADHPWLKFSGHRHDGSARTHAPLSERVLKARARSIRGGAICAIDGPTRRVFGRREGL